MKNLMATGAVLALVAGCVAPPEELCDRDQIRTDKHMRAKAQAKTNCGESPRRR